MLKCLRIGRPTPRIHIYYILINNRMVQHETWTDVFRGNKLESVALTVLVVCVVRYEKSATENDDDDSNYSHIYRFHRNNENSSKRNGSIVEKS